MHTLSYQKMSTHLHPWRPTHSCSRSSSHSRRRPSHLIPPRIRLLPFPWLSSRCSHFEDEFSSITIAMFLAPFIPCMFNTMTLVHVQTSRIHSLTTPLPPRGSESGNRVSALRSRLTGPSPATACRLPADWFKHLLVWSTWVYKYIISTFSRQSNQGFSIVSVRLPPFIYRTQLPSLNTVL